MNTGGPGRSTEGKMAKKDKKSPEQQADSQRFSSPEVTCMVGDLHSIGS